MRRLKGTEPLASGARDYIRLLLSEPLLLLPGDRFIVRMFSPVVTIGGGVVLDIAAPKRGSSERLRILENRRPQKESRSWPPNPATVWEWRTWWPAPD